MQTTDRWPNGRGAGLDTIVEVHRWDFLLLLSGAGTAERFGVRTIWRLARICGLLRERGVTTEWSDTKHQKGMLDGTPITP